RRPGEPLALRAFGGELLGLRLLRRDALGFCLLARHSLARQRFFLRPPLLFGETQGLLLARRLLRLRPLGGDTLGVDALLLALLRGNGVFLDLGVVVRERRDLLLPRERVLRGLVRRFARGALLREQRLQLLLALGETRLELLLEPLPALRLLPLHDLLPLLR